MAKDKDRENLLAEVKNWIHDYPESQLVNEDLEKMTTDEIRNQLESEKPFLNFDGLEQPKEKEL